MSTKDSQDYELRDISAPEHVVTHSQQEKFHGPIFTIYDDEIEFTSGDVARRQYMLHNDAVAIVALRAADELTEDTVDRSTIPLTLDNAEILLIRQYRHPVRSLLWEIPAGLRDHADEDGLLAAQRELAEEADLQADSWKPLVSFLSSPGCSTENLDIYMAEGVRPVTADSNPAAGFERREEEREIVVKWWPLEEVYKAVVRRDLRNPSLIAGVLASRSALLNSSPQFSTP